MGSGHGKGEEVAEDLSSRPSQIPGPKSRPKGSKNPGSRREALASRPVGGYGVRAPGVGGAGNLRPRCTETKLGFGAWQS